MGFVFDDVCCLATSFCPFGALFCFASCQGMQFVVSSVLNVDFFGSVLECFSGDWIFDSFASGDGERLLFVFFQGAREVF